MKNELLLLIKKHSDTLIEQRETKPQETLEYKMNKQWEVFSFNPVIDLIEEGKLLLAVTSFEATNSLFNITDEKNSFSNTIPGRCRILNYLEDGVIDKLKKLLKLRSQNDIQLHVEKVRKRGNQIEIGDE